MADVKGLVPVAVLGFAISACSSAGLFTPDVVFLEVTHHEVDCPPDVADDVACLVVRAPVEGDSQGRGSCWVYPKGLAESPKETARNDDITMIPGQTSEWEVQVEVPDAPSFEGFYAVCSPMIEG